MVRLLLSQSLRNKNQHFYGKSLFIPASQLVSNGVGNSIGLRLKTLEPPSIPALTFGFRSLDRMVGGFKTQDLTVLYGSRHALKLSHLLAVNAQLPLHKYGFDSSVLFVDAGCSFDPHGISSLARLHGLLPQDVLERIRVSRAFTAYQLSSLIYDWLPRAIEDYDARLVILSSIIRLFTDLDMPREELLTSFSRLSRFLSNLALKEEVAVIVTIPSRCNSPKRHTLLRLLKSRADIIMELKEKRNYLRLILERHPRAKPGLANIPFNPFIREVTLQDFLGVKEDG